MELNFEQTKAITGMLYMQCEMLANMRMITELLVKLTVNNPEEIPEEIAKVEEIIKILSQKLITQFYGEHGTFDMNEILPKNS